jgi:hypothetical protein
METPPAGTGRPARYRSQFGRPSERYCRTAWPSPAHVVAVRPFDAEHGRGLVGQTGADPDSLSIVIPLGGYGLASGLADVVEVVE